MIKWRLSFKVVLSWQGISLNEFAKSEFAKCWNFFQEGSANCSKWSESFGKKNLALRQICLRNFWAISFGLVLSAIPFLFWFLQSMLPMISIVRNCLYDIQTTHEPREGMGYGPNPKIFLKKSEKTYFELFFNQITKRQDVHKSIDKFCQDFWPHTTLKLSLEAYKIVRIAIVQMQSFEKKLWVRLFECNCSKFVFSNLT